METNISEINKEFNQVCQENVEGRQKRKDKKIKGALFLEEGKAKKKKKGSGSESNDPFPSPFPDLNSQTLKTLKTFYNNFQNLFDMG